MGKTLNENIKELRLLRGLNQVEFAKLMGVTKQCISNWENDNVLPSIEMLMKMAKFFGVSTDSLLGLETQKTLDVSGLTPAQISHLSVIVSDLRK
jgi:transcriptional regulator with XRE-family HTH domain